LANSCYVVKGPLDSSKSVKLFDDEWLLALKAPCSIIFPFLSPVQMVITQKLKTVVNCKVGRI
jgi:hypothetical protein